MLAAWVCCSIQRRPAASHSAMTRAYSARLSGALDSAFPDGQPKETKPEGAPTDAAKPDEPKKDEPKKEEPTKTEADARMELVLARRSPRCLAYSWPTTIATSKRWLLWP